MFGPRHRNVIHWPWTSTARLERMNAEQPSSGEGPVEVVFLNGASSSGKTTLAVALQDLFEETWLIFGIDTLISAIPLTLLEEVLDATASVVLPELDLTKTTTNFAQLLCSLVSQSTSTTMIVPV